MPESGAGVRIDNPRIYRPDATNAIPPIPATVDPRLITLFAALREFAQQIGKILHDYRLGIVRELPILDPNGAKVGWIGFNAPNIGISTPSLLLGSAPSQTSSFTVSASYSFYPINATSGAVTVTLPPIAESRGRTLIFQKTDATANALTIDGSGSETINGAATQSTTTQYGVLRLIAGPTEWHLF